MADYSGDGVRAGVGDARSDDHEDGVGRERETTAQMEERQRIAAALLARIEAAARRNPRIHVVDESRRMDRYFNILTPTDAINPNQIGEAAGDRRVVHRLMAGSVPRPALLAKLADVLGEPVDEWFEIAHYPLLAGASVPMLSDDLRALDAAFRTMGLHGEARREIVRKALAFAHERHPTTADNHGHGKIDHDFQGDATTETPDIRQG